MLLEYDTNQKAGLEPMMTLGEIRRLQQELKKSVSKTCWYCAARGEFSKAQRKKNDSLCCECVKKGIVAFFTHFRVSARRFPSVSSIQDDECLRTEPL